MADFPSLEPASRSWSMGAYPVTMQPAWGMAPFAFRHGLKPAAHALALGYQLLTAAQAAQIRSHYHGQRGQLLPFSLPSIIWRGALSATGPVDEATQWRYVSPPEETHRVGGLVDMTVELESVI